MKKSLLFIVMSIFWILLLFPKDTAWNTFVDYVKSKHITIDAKSVQDKRYKFALKNVKISYRGMYIGSVEAVSIKPWLLYNNIELKKFKLSRNLPIMKRLDISQAKATLSIINPLIVKIKGVSSYGVFTGEILLFKHKITILFKNKKIKETILRDYFKRTKEGMRYEFSY